MSIIRFIKNWTLPVSITGGIIIYLIFAPTPALDGAARFCAPICDRILPLFMFLILFVTFCKVDFRRLVPVKWILWVSVVQVALVALATLITVEPGSVGAEPDTDGGHTNLYHRALRSSGSGGYGQVRWQPGADDYLHVYL